MKNKNIVFQYLTVLQQNVVTFTNDHNLKYSLTRAYLIFYSPFFEHYLRVSF